MNLLDSCLKVFGFGYVVLVDMGLLSKMVSDFNGIGLGLVFELDNVKY